MNQEKIGKFICECRKKKNLTQEELAEKLGVTNKTISRWETGKFMPDISLFSPLSEILGININELMSGEIIDEDKYQQNFEKNVVQVISNVDKKNKFYNIITNIFLGIIVAFIICFLFGIFYFNFSFRQKYNDEMMSIEELSDGNINFKTNTIGDIRYLLTSDTKNQGLIFVYFQKTLSDYHQDNKNFSNSHRIDLINNYNGHQIIITNDEFPEKYKVYYTETGLKKIAKANSEELQKIIEKSYLMFEK